MINERTSPHTVRVYDGKSISEYVFDHYDICAHGIVTVFTRDQILKGMLNVINREVCLDVTITPTNHSYLGR